MSSTKAGHTGCTGASLTQNAGGYSFVLTANVWYVPDAFVLNTVRSTNGLLCDRYSVEMMAERNWSTTLLLVFFWASSSMISWSL
jgi:hypothetical protein